jgi:hypothetical protein
MFGGKWLEIEKKRIFEGINPRIAKIYIESEYDAFRLVQKVRGKIYLVLILQILQRRVGSKKMDFAPPVILETGQREGQQDRKRKNTSFEILEFSSHIKPRELGSFILKRKPLTSRFPHHRILIHGKKMSRQIWRN